MASLRTTLALVSSPIPQLVGVTVFFASALYTFSCFGNLFYHILGFFLASIAVFSYYHFLERRIRILAYDKRFSEYGIVPILHADHLFLRRGQSPTRFIAYAKPIAKVIFSGILPPYGFSIVALLPFDLLEARKTIRMIDSYYRIGEGVEEMIARGCSQEEIRARLSSP